MRVHLIFEKHIEGKNMIDIVCGLTHSRTNENNVVKENIYEIKKADYKNLVEIIACKPVLCDKKEAKFKSGNLNLKPTQGSSDGIYKNGFIDRIMKH